MLRGIDLHGARLRSWILAGAADRPLDLTDARLAAADLRDCTIRHALLN